MAVVLACMTVVLLMAGALVTSNEAGDSVPDWPMSFGRWVLGSRQFVGNIRFEYSHRVVAGAVGVMTLLTACCAWLCASAKSRYRWLALAAVIGVVLQAAIGGVRVLLPGYKALIAVPHALIAQSFFCAVVSLAVITSRAWNQAGSSRLYESAAPLRSLSIATAGAVMVQLLFGAGFRHGAIGIAPHIGGAVGVVLLVSWTALKTLRFVGTESYLCRPVLTLCGLLVIQIGLGIGSYLARLASVNDPQPMEPMISLTVAHVVVGALTLASAVVVALRCNQVIPAASSLRAYASGVPAA